MDSIKSLYGLVGYPLGHSLSPLMHNAAFNHLGVDATYELFPLKEEELDVFFADLHEQENPIFGLNVTVPYKEKVVKYIDSITPFAQKAGAVNTIVVGKNRKLIGYNTDGPGFLTHITELGFDTTDKKISILGAGGATRAIVTVLGVIIERPKTIKIYDIDTQKAQSLIEDLKIRINVDNIEIVHSIDDLDIKNAELLINATPIGLKKTDASLIEEELLHSKLLVYDLIYNPKETEMLKTAKRKGAKVSNGLGMLFYQGVLAFQHWADQELDAKTKNIMRKALEKGLEKNHD